MKVLVTNIGWPDTTIEEKVLAAVDASTVLAETGEEDELVELVRDADAILTCFAHVTPAVVAAGERLRVIGRYGVGTDNIAVEDATRRGIPVADVPVYCTDEVAEHVLAMLLAHVRGLVPYDRAVRRGDWSLANGLPTRRVASRTLGVVGFGAIGQALARKARDSTSPSSRTTPTRRACVRAVPSRSRFSSWPGAPTSFPCTSRYSRPRAGWSAASSWAR